MNQMERKDQSIENGKSADDLLDLIEQELEDVAGGSSHPPLTGCLGIRG